MAMIYDNQPLMELIEKGKRNGYIAIKDILELIDEDSEDFDEIAKLLESENIDLVRGDDLSEHENDNGIPEDDEGFDFEGFIGDLEADTEFNEFTNEIESELKTKDIDDPSRPCRLRPTIP